jgi:hypothetical protein
LISVAPDFAAKAHAEDSWSNGLWWLSPVPENPPQSYTPEQQQDWRALHNARQLMALLSNAHTTNTAGIFLDAAQEFHRTYADSLRKVLDGFVFSNPWTNWLSVEDKQAIRVAMKAVDVSRAAEDALVDILKYQRATTPGGIKAFYGTVSGSTKFLQPDASGHLQGTAWLLKKNSTYPLNFYVTLHFPGGSVKSLHYVSRRLGDYVYGKVGPLLGYASSALGPFVHEWVTAAMHEALAAAANKLSAASVLTYGFHVHPKWRDWPYDDVYLEPTDLADVEIGDTRVLSIPVWAFVPPWNWIPAWNTHLIGILQANNRYSVQAGNVLGATSIVAEFQESFKQLGFEGAHSTQGMVFRVVDDERRVLPDVVSPMPVWSAPPLPAPRLPAPILYPLPPPRAPDPPKPLPPPASPIPMDQCQYRGNPGYLNHNLGNACEEAK